ncbi:MAG: hypothetical protein V7782_14395, partial [Psychromonas sp.]
MKGHFIFLSTCLVSFNSFSSGDPFAELDKEMTLYQQQSQHSAVEENDFEKFMGSQQTEYEQWRDQYLKDFDQFQKQVVQKWGEADSSQKQRNVEFSEDMQVKSTIDYQNEEITVAVLVDKDLSLSEAETKVR